MQFGVRQLDHDKRVDFEDMKDMQTDKAALIYGALLHDIGKIICRGTSEKGTHAKLGAQFISNEVAVKNVDFAGELGAKIIDQIRYHHAIELSKANLPDDSLAWITYFADTISEGMDRKQNDATAEQFTFEHDIKMRKIFNILNGRTDDNTIDHDDYNSIREHIKNGLSSMTLSPESINSLLVLLETTISSVPSSTNTSEMIDVSLYDHAKTSAAIASCIYDYLTQNQSNNFRATLFDKDLSKDYYEKDMFLLYSWDMSGIQKFIYSISGEGALKQLRARSLYLDLMMEHVADEFLERLELSRANLLYLGGGHAYFLLPNTQLTKEIAASFMSELSAWLLSQFRIDLYIADAMLACSGYDLSNYGDDKSRFGNLFRMLTEQLSAKKASRYSAELLYELNFGENDAYQSDRECKECLRSDSDLGRTSRCQLCTSLGEISKNLAEKDVFAVIDNQINQTSNVLTNQPSLQLPFNKSLVMLSENDYKVKQPDTARIYTKGWNAGIKFAAHIWMGDYTAQQDGKGISAYAADGVTLQDGFGINRLGVVRADVDNLGAVFVQGIPQDKASISRTATLSRALSYFFRKKINDILTEKNYCAQIVYSGGDDLFILGNWSDIIYAAIDIRNAFVDFQGNGVLTMSAGIGMFSKTYPLARMADEVETLETAAKMYTSPLQPDKVKNAIALWSDDTVYSWEDFSDKVAAKKTYLEKELADNEKGKAFIYKIISLLRNSEDVISAPRIAYLLARSFEDSPSSSMASKKLYEWAMDLEERASLITALEWYMYSIREKG